MVGELRQGLATLGTSTSVIRPSRGREVVEEVAGSE